MAPVEAAEGHGSRSIPDVSGRGGNAAGLRAPATTAALVGKVRAGDTAAFTTLYRDNVGAVIRAVRDNVHDAETVADVTQEVFVRALERLDSLRDPARFRPWLLSIARHAAIDHRRSRRNAPDALEDAVGEPVDTGQGPDDVAEVNDLARFVQGCVGGLSRRDATALTLVTQFGLRAPEVAVALGVSVGTAKVILFRARRRLRDAVTLELMIRRKAAGWPDLALELDLDDLVAAAKHVRSCVVCAALVENEIELYAAVGSTGSAL